MARHGVGARALRARSRIWEWAGNLTHEEPDVVLACAGDTPTLEVLAAADRLRTNVPSMRVRVVNIVDLMTLFSPREHPHGMDQQTFEDLFTADTHVVFSFHGYPGAIHQLLHGRASPTRFHVRGYEEDGTTTTPFDMVVLNETSRYHIVWMRFGARSDPFPTRTNARRIV